MRKSKGTTDDDKLKEKISDTTSTQNAPKSAFNDEQHVYSGPDAEQSRKTKKMTFFGYFKKKDNQPTIANVVSIVAVIISGILAVFTYYLYHIASGQVESVVKAGNAAQSSAVTARNTLNETKRFNINYLKLQTDAFNKANSDAAKRDKLDKENSDRQKQSVDAQIASLKETKNEFEIENRPFIVIGNIVADTPSIGKKLNFSAAIGNAGKQPAFIISASYDFVTGVNSTYSDMKNITLQNGLKNDYISNNQTIPVIGDTKSVINIADVELLKKTKGYLYFKGIIIYRGLVKNKIYKIKFIYRIDLDIHHASKTVLYEIE